MSSLDRAQANFIATINNGPEVLDPELFSGPIDRVLLGLRAHANTISHARLVALEETFPRTREHLGDTAFNVICRAYVEDKVARACDNNSIGRHFAEQLHADPQAAELAAIEWAWLESYHAADAVPMVLADLSALDEAALVALPVSAHPAARLVPTICPVAASLTELAGQQPAAILIARPVEVVRLVPLDAIEAAVFTAATANSATMGNLLTTAIEQAGDDDPLRPIITLISAGALVAGG